MTDDTIQTLMNSAYETWRKHNETSDDRWNYDQFVDHLDGREYPAVLIGNLNYQVGNGGFSQWHFNGYSSRIDDLLIIVSIIARTFPIIDVSKRVLAMLLEVNDVLENFEEVTYEDEEEEYYDDDLDEWVTEWNEVEVYHEPELDHLDSRYYDLQDDWLKTVDLFLSMTDYAFNEAITLPLLSTSELRELSNMQSNPPSKPRVKLIGENGNIFNLLGIATKALRRNNMGDKAKELTERATKAASYDEALAIITDYVEVY